MRIFTRIFAWISIVAALSFMYTLMQVPGVVRVQPINADPTSFEARGQLIFLSLSMLLPLITLLIAVFTLVYTGAYLRMKRQLNVYDMRDAIDSRYSKGPADPNQTDHGGPPSSVSNLISQ